MRLENSLKVKSSKSERVKGLDSIRLLCAIWVACSHGGYPPITVLLDTTNFIGWMVNGVYTSLFCGPAAVIVFFVISGFCIHFPYRKSWSKTFIIPFIVARLARILIPIIFASFFIRMIGFNTSIFYLLVGWSIICEIAYYLFYPFLRSLIDEPKYWLFILAFSYIPTLLAFLIFPLDLVNYPGVGFYYVIALGFPCWILGVLLCYTLNYQEKNKNTSLTKLTLCRICIFSIGFATHVLALQEIIGHAFTLNFFAIGVFFWLKEEIHYYQDNTPSIFLEKLGKTSYSIYLMHGIPPFLLNFLNYDYNYMSAFFSYWVILVILTCIFYFLVEKPSHFLSRKLFISLAR